jgi:hypothetical protein
MKREEELEFISVEANDDDFSMNQKYPNTSAGIRDVGDSAIGGWIFKQSKVIFFIYLSIN